MFTEVVKAEYVDGYRIRLWFNNQVIKVVLYLNRSKILISSSGSQ